MTINEHKGPETMCKQLHIVPGPLCTVSMGLLPLLYYHLPVAANIDTLSWLTHNAAP